MSSIRNQVTLIGNVGDAPKVTRLDDGKTVARFPMATNEQYRNEHGEKVQTTDWHYIKAWGKTAEIIEKYVTKGKQVAVSGKLKTSTYNTESGDERRVTDIVIDEILLLGSKSDGDAE
ncbi:MAG: single-stranded DNA-binding protein [Flavobacteriaceae bacterium]|nr:single-stranded DNA-binding protein [Flavobacteriaceae bacterium]